MEILATIKTSNIAWVFCNKSFYFTREIGSDYKTALSKFAKISSAVPHGFLNEDSNILTVSFDDEFVYSPYSIALKGLRDLDFITNDTLIQFPSFNKKASLIFKQILAVEKQDILNSVEQDFEFSVGRFRYA